MPLFLLSVPVAKAACRIGEEASLSMSVAARESGATSESCWVKASSDLNIRTEPNMAHHFQNWQC
jgi:hypothetical protein